MQISPKGNKAARSLFAKPRPSRRKKARPSARAAVSTSLGAVVQALSSDNDESPPAIEPNMTDVSTALSTNKGPTPSSLSALSKFLQLNRNKPKAFRITVKIYYKNRDNWAIIILKDQAQADQGSDINLVSRNRVKFLGRRHSLCRISVLAAFICFPRIVVTLAS